MYQSLTAERMYKQVMGGIAYMFCKAELLIFNHDFLYTVQSRHTGMLRLHTCSLSFRNTGCHLPSADLRYMLGIVMVLDGV